MARAMHDILHQAFINNHNTLSVHDYMGLCNKLYYEKGEALGRQGDFITAPELTPLFGEIIGLSLLEAWQRLGSPPTFDLIECGPGRGLLMQDVLRITASFETFHQALCLKFVEINSSFAYDHPCHIFTDLSQALENKPTFLIANEFFDALPIKQFVRQGENLAERYIYNSFQRLTFSHNDAEVIKETCPIGEDLFQTLAQHLQTWGGAGIIIDYGYNSLEVTGNTLQAVAQHAFTSPLEKPGEQDLTAHVNFDPFIAYATSLNLKGYFETQRQFLLSRGLYTRAQQVITSLPEPQRLPYEQALKRLIDPQAMGTLFKVLWVENNSG